MVPVDLCICISNLHKFVFSLGIIALATDNDVALGTDVSALNSHYSNMVDPI